MNNKIIEIISSDAETLIKNNKSFCAAPWIHTHIWPDGRVFPCCMSEYDAVLGNVNQSNSFTEIWNNENYRNLRKDMIEGNLRPDICNRCYEQEKHDIDSMRKNLTKDYWKETKQQLEKTDDEYKTDLCLPYWDYRFNNICNLSCRTCGPDLSSSWYKDHLSRYGIPPPYSKTKFVIFDANKKGNIHEELIENQIENVKEIYFAGGEPIIMPEHLDVLERLIANNKTDITLRYSTNLTTLSYKGVDFTQLWPKFKKVLLFVSLDEIEERAEYWRNGTNWNRLKDNIKQIVNLSKQHPNFQFGYAPTISIFNIHRLDRIMEYLIDNQLIDKTRTMFVYNILQDPKEFSIKFAPPALKKIALESLEKLESMVGPYRHHKKDIENIRKWLADTPVDDKEYFQSSKHIAEIDKVRSQHLNNVAPELYEIYKQYEYDLRYNSFSPH